MLAQWLRIGIITKPQGVKGELKVQPLTDDPARFLALNQVFLETPGGYQPRRVLSARTDPAGAAYLRLEGVDSRNGAEPLRGLYLCVDRDHAVPLAEDTYFICDLVGCTVYDLNGVARGELVEVLQPPAQDVYVVRGDREWLVPAVAAFVRSVDVQARRVVVDFSQLQEVEA